MTDPSKCLLLLPLRPRCWFLLLFLLLCPPVASLLSLVYDNFYTHSKEIA